MKKITMITFVAWGVVFILSAEKGYSADLSVDSKNTGSISVDKTVSNTPDTGLEKQGVTSGIGEFYGEITNPNPEAKPDPGAKPVSPPADCPEPEFTIHFERTACSMYRADTCGDFNEGICSPVPSGTPYVVDSSFRGVRESDG